MTVTLTAHTVNVTMRGEIDIGAAPGLAEAAQAIAALGPPRSPTTGAAASGPRVPARRPVTVDCRELTFMDSSALTFFVRLVHADTAVTVSGLRPRLQHLLTITGLDRRVRVMADSPD